MLRLDAALARPAVKQHGLATREQVRHVGLTDDEIDNRIEAGVLRLTPYRGVLHHAATPFTDRTRVMGAVLAAGPTAVASHRSAAVLHGFDEIRRFRPEITVWDTTKPKLADATVHRTDTLDAIDRCKVDGIPTTSRPRTYLDLGAVLPFEVVEHVVQVGIIENAITELDLIAVLDRLGKPGRRGTAALRATVRGSIPDERLQSMLEHELHQLIKLAGIPAPELQYRLVCADGTVVDLDFAWPEFRIGAEADGRRWHATRAQLEHDLKRRRSIQASGWDHYAYGWGDVHHRKLAVVAELRSLFVALTVPTTV